MTGMTANQAEKVMTDSERISELAMALGHMLDAIRELNDNLHDDLDFRVKSQVQYELAEAMIHAKRVIVRTKSGWARPA